MKESTITCYMCGKATTGGEHVPPKCIFPEQKDLPKGVDYRKRLYTVPSCYEHNSKKSKDDEYLCYVLTMMNQSNLVGRNQYTSKTRRAINRNHDLLRRFAAQGGIVGESLAFHLEENRFDRITDRLARAIYYLHYKEKWLNRILYHPEFLRSTTDPENEDRTISIEADSIFSDAAFYGDNPEVFKYQAVEGVNLKEVRLHFYEGCKFYLQFRGDAAIKWEDDSKNKD